MNGIILYITIFIAKSFEVSLATLRIMLINKGERNKGTIIAFFEIILWLIIVNTVLQNIAKDPLKGLAYALGFCMGNYIGSIAENKLALGNIEISAILDKEKGEMLTENLRNSGFAVTTIDGEGKDSSKKILLLIVKRKSIKTVIDTIKNYTTDVVITTSDTKPLYGGYGIGSIIKK